MKRALIVTDVQNGFVEQELPVPNATEIIPVINKLIEKYELIVGTQDWHPADHLSFASQHPGKKPFDMGELAGRPHTLWPDHCVAGTWGSEFVQGLHTDRFAAVFRKGMDRKVDSYSGFMDDHGRHFTGLAGFLRERAAEDIHICGLTLDYCVKATALDAIKAGFKVWVHIDATRWVTEEGRLQACEEMAANGIVLLE